MTVPVQGSPFKTVTVTIANGGTVSSFASTNGKIIIGVAMGTLIGTTLGFQCDADGTFRTVKDESGNALSKTVASDEFLSLNPPLMLGPNVKLVSGSTETNGATLTLLLAP